LDFLSLDYRDPLYGVILLFAIVTIIYLSNYWARFFKKKEDDESIEKFIKNFGTSSNFSEYKQMIQKQNLPTESIILMALSYEQSGEYEKAIEIYSALLESVFEQKQRRNILTQLGKTYYKAGFLYKSRDIFLENLKLYPKNEEALTYLISIYESLREYNSAIEILKVLENINDEDLSEKRQYFKILSIIQNQNSKNEDKIKQIVSLGINKKIVQRKLFEFASTEKIELPKEILQKFDFENIIDLIWDMEEDYFDKEFIKSNRLLSQIYTAKGKCDFAQESENFELNTLIKLSKVGDTSSDITFTYGCRKCKNVFPLYFYRCPVCKNINSATINTTLTRREYETGSFV